MKSFVMSCLPFPFGPRHFALVDARTASASLGGGEADDGGVETLTLDALANFDGLERLIVIGVGLDVPIDGAAAGETLTQRSMLYRGITRAHMMAILVNESTR